MIVSVIGMHNVEKLQLTLSIRLVYDTERITTTMTLTVWVIILLKNIQQKIMF